MARKRRQRGDRVMRWGKIDEQLAAAFATPKLQSDNVDSWRAQEAADLEPLVRAACENEAEEATLDDEGVRGALARAGLADEIIDWSWDSMGPMTQSASLDR